MKYGKCKKYGFSLLNFLKNILKKKNGWIELGIQLPTEESEEEE